ncbi:helix-turn-helix domain-containing protein [Actinospica sp.]|uniref:TetR/AcrR family transcriptional regulator n=1 Tax=Actinospica sp. TaxID=1872142 RepID=UPI002C1CCE08|nr:helix-turn-helix domain-containing protein [Actinospica sp.]HWG26385.1 helix-turn-helix domain-containing protein [Actinospica sp.]
MAVEPSDPPPRRRRDVERNRRRILTGAREVFRDRGVAATLNDIARHTGVGVGTVYRHFSDKEQLVDALSDDMVETVDGHLRTALEEPDAWTGLTQALEKVCELQSFDRGLREVMLGTGRGPERARQMRERVAPTVDALVARAHEQGSLRAEIIGPDFPILQLMLGAVTDHTGHPELWRRYFALLIDGLRARPDDTPMPELNLSDEAFQDAVVSSSTRSADAAGGTGAAVL